MTDEQLATEHFFDQRVTTMPRPGYEWDETLRRYVEPIERICERVEALTKALRAAKGNN